MFPVVQPSCVAASYSARLDCICLFSPLSRHRRTSRADITHGIWWSSSKPGAAPRPSTWMISYKYEHVTRRHCPKVCYPCTFWSSCVTEAAVTLTKAQSQEEKSKTSTGRVNFSPCYYYFFLTTILPVNLLQAEHVPQPLAPLLAEQRQAEDW